MNQAFNDCLNGWNSLGKTFCGYAGSAFVQSALLVILLLALDVLWHKRVRAVFRYCVWLLVLVKLVLPPTLSLPTGIGYWVGDHLPAATGVSERVFPPMGEERLEQHLPAAAQASGALPAVPPPAEGPTSSAPAAPAILPPTSLTWQGVVLLFWSAGVLAFIALVAQRLRFVRGLVAASTPAGQELLGLLEECARQMGVRRPVGLRTLDTLPSPAVCGLRRPMILMPTALVERLSPEGLQAALIHELAHIRRADLWINAVQTLLQILYFYNPFVWLANAVIRRTCEEAVDETVLVTLGGRAKNYSNTLIDISEMAFWKADFGLRLVGVAESRRALQGRIKHMLTRPIPKSTRIGALGTIMILAVAVVLLPMARGTPGRQSGTSSLMDRVQQEDDTELADMIRTAVANHKGASEKEILEITRRVTQGRAQILLLDEQIAQIAREIEATPTSAEAHEKLLLTKKELETKQTMEMANLREAMGIVPKPATERANLPEPAGVDQDKTTTAKERIGPPGLKVFELSPADGAEGVGVNSLELTWPAGDKAKAHNVYLGPGPESLKLLGQVEQVGAKVSHLKCNTKYYWRVDEVQADGSVVSGNVSAFTTGGLAAWWKLDETAGREAVDSSDNHHDGVLNGNPIRQPQGGKRGGAVQFDGVRDFIDTGWADNLATWTVGVWVKGKSAPTRAQPPNGLVHREYNFQINWDHYKPEFRGAAAVRIGIAWHPVSFGNLDGGIWYHLVATFDGESIKAYKDGVLVDEDSQAYGRPNVEAATLKLGRHAVDQGYFAGTIDDVCIFSYALSVDEVKALYSGTTPTALTAPPVSSDAKIVFAPLDTRAGPVPPKRAKVPFDKLATANLNAWVKLQVLEQRVLVLETLKAFSDNWALARHKVVGLWSERETLDYLQGRLKDKRSLPIRLHVFFLPELKNAAEDLQQKIFALAREAKVDTETEIWMEPSTWVGSGESPFYLREGKIRTYYPRSVAPPDGGRQWLANGLVDPNDLEQHILWRLTMPKNLPLTFRIEYDEASYQLARQVADTAKAVAKSIGLTDLVGVAGTLVEPVPESAFVGRWQALGNAVIQSVEFQPGGGFQVMMGEGSPVLKAGTSVKGTWVWTVREIMLDIGDPVLGRTGYPPYRYRATVNEDGNLVIERGEIYPQGSFMFTRPPQMIFKKVPPQSEPARTELESERRMGMGSLPEATGTSPHLPFAKQPTASLNARVSLQVLEQQVLVLDTLKPFSEYWARARYTPVGLLSENEALDYVQRRLKDRRSLPLRIDVHYRPETADAAQRLHEKIAALARETNTDMQTDLRLQMAAYAGSGVSTFLLREGKIRTFHPDPVRRPDGGPRLLASGVVEVNDLEQHILWRLLHPGNVPLTFRIEYDDASSTLAKQVADTAKAVAKRTGLAELVEVTGTLVEPVPETIFLGRWQALTPGAMQTIDIQPRGVCLVTMDQGTQVIKAGANVPGMWLPTTKEIIVDINDKVPDKAHYVYRAYVETGGDLVVDRGVIYRQGSFHNSDPQPVVFRKVQ